MQTHFRRTFPAALVALLASVPAAAQEAQGNVTVGAPELRDFRLPGTRVVPAPVTEPVAPPADEQASPPPAAEQAPAPAARTTPAPAPVDRPAARTAAPAPNVAAPPQAPDTPPEAAPDTAIAFPSAAGTYSPGDFDTAPAPAPVLPVEQPAGTDDEIISSGMIWPALAAALALLAGLFFFRRQRSALAAEGPALARAAVPEAAEPPASDPVRTPIAAATREEDEAVRPVLEVEFKPDRLVATDAQAAVHFALTVRNSGKGPARNIRIEARMFNASAQQKQEIAAFLASPAQSDGAAGQIMQPGQAVAYRSTVVMPKESVREIRIDGRPLFIPTVAVRIVYQWGQGRSGRTHRTYLIGIENQKSPEKMGPFRLDLGPRIYRSVGGRQIELARAS